MLLWGCGSRGLLWGSCPARRRWRRGRVGGCDGGSFGQVAANASVGVFVGSSLPGAVGVSEKHLHASAWGEALVTGHFLSLIPCQCSHHSFG